MAAEDYVQAYKKNRDDDNKSVASYSKDLYKFLILMFIETGKTGMTNKSLRT